MRNTDQNTAFAKELSILNDWAIDLETNVKSVSKIIVATEMKNKLVFSQSSNTATFPLRTILGVASAMIVVLFAVVLLQPSSNIFEGTYTTKVSKHKFDLRDGTEVVLDRTSSLKPVNKRQVEFDGRGYFKVESSPSNPFNIETSAGLVQVLGTEFSLQVNGDDLELYVTEGVVKFEKDGRSAMVYAGSFINVSKDNIELVNNVTDNYLSWYKDNLTFRSATIPQVLEAINHHFNLNITMENVLRGEDAVITSKFNNPDLQTVIDELVKNGCVIDEKAL